MFLLTPVFGINRCTEKLASTPLHRAFLTTWWWWWGGGGRPGYQDFGDRSTPAKEEQQIRLEKVVQRDKSKGKTIKSRCI
jgi:hypothetical protein